MEENCEDCMKQEEEIYWTHFQTLHFSKLLLPGFHNHLDIPENFSSHCKTKLPETVTLKSPSGVTYNVRVEEDEEKKLAFRCGWDKFVKDHSLEENDLLVFKFHRSSEFEVMVFDGRTLCEKPTSYFVRKCGHAEKKIKVSQNGYEEEGHINSDNDITSSQPLVVSHTSNGRISEGKYSLRAFKKMRGEKSNDNLDRIAGVEMISDSSKTRALSQAKRAISPDGFLIILKPTHVLGDYSLTIPVKWCKKNNMLLSHQDVVMQMGQTKWDMKFKFSASRGRAGITSGWKKFVQDNNLSVSDVCVFEPANSEEMKPFHFLVYIFRDEETISTNVG